MEKTAVTFWEGIVSPVYDASRWMMIVGAGGERGLADVGGMSIHGKAEFLRSENVGTVICGAISDIALATLHARGVRVVPWIRGYVDDVVEAYLAGTLGSRSHRMPGCRASGQWCRRRGRRRTRRQSRAGHEN